MSKTILVLLPTDEAQKQELKAAAPGARFIYSTYESVTEEQVKAAQIILGNPPYPMLQGAGSLEFLQLNSAGVGKYAEKGMLPPNAKLCCATGSYGLAISEYMLGVLLMLLKKLHRYRDNQRQHLWKDEGPVTSIAGATVLVVGLGDIGGAFARKIKALGAEVIGIKRTLSEKPSYLDGLYPLSELDALLPRADVVALSLPKTPQTRGLFQKERFSRMKPGSILLNVGRGACVDTDALCDAVESGHLRGAALDVVDPEPLPPEHRLWNIPDIILTPHVSGGYHLKATLDKIVALAAKNLKAFLNGEPLTSEVDFAAGYRKAETKA